MALKLKKLDDVIGTEVTGVLSAKTIEKAVCCEGTKLVEWGAVKLALNLALVDVGDEVQARQSACSLITILNFVQNAIGHLISTAAAGDKVVQIAHKLERLLLDILVVGRIEGRKFHAINQTVERLVNLHILCSNHVGALHGYQFSAVLGRC